MCCCCREPLAGFYRDGYCRTGLGDGGLHTICARMSEELLNFSDSRGNDLITPRFNFPGLKEGDRWCVCVTGWKEALEAGLAPPEELEATHSCPLEFANLKSCRRTRYPLIDLYFWIGFVKKRSVLCLRRSICRGRSPRLSTRGSK